MDLRLCVGEQNACIRTIESSHVLTFIFMCLSVYVLYFYFFYFLLLLLVVLLLLFLLLVACLLLLLSSKWEYISWVIQIHWNISARLSLSTLMRFVDKFFCALVHLLKLFSSLFCLIFLLHFRLAFSHIKENKQHFCVKRPSKRTKHIKRKQQNCCMKTTETVIPLFLGLNP